jgi:hypothetical protein
MLDDCRQAIDDLRHGEQAKVWIARAARDATSRRVDGVEPGPSHEPCREPVVGPWRHQDRIASEELPQARGGTHGAHAVLAKFSLNCAHRIEA